MLRRGSLLLTCLVFACSDSEAPEATTSTSSGSSSSAGSSDSSTSSIVDECGPAEMQDDSLGALLLCAGFDSQLVDWQLIGEDPAAWRIEESTFELWSLPGTLWSDINSLRNFALRPTPVDFNASVQVTAAEISEISEQAGLLYYEDDDNYVKLVHERSGGADGEIVVVMAVERGGNPVVLGRSEPVGAPVGLRLEVGEDSVHGLWRPDPGSPWSEIDTASHPGANSRLGLFSHGAPEGVERWATFSDFSVDG